jgi:hypothetical protein
MVGAAPCIHVSRTQVDVPYFIAYDIVFSGGGAFELAFLVRSADHDVDIMAAAQLAVVLQEAVVVLVVVAGVYFFYPALPGVGYTVVSQRAIPLIQGYGLAHIRTVPGGIHDTGLQVQFQSIGDIGNQPEIGIQVTCIVIGSGCFFGKCQRIAPATLCKEFTVG